MPRLRRIAIRRRDAVVTRVLIEPDAGAGDGPLTLARQARVTPPALALPPRYAWSFIFDGDTDAAPAAYCDDDRAGCTRKRRVSS